MRMAFAELGLNILFEDNMATEFLIESPDLYQRIISKLLDQYNGNYDGFVFSDNDKELRLDKSADIILNPFQIDINNRKILTKVYLDVVKEQEEINLEFMHNLYSEMERFVINICEQSDYALTYDKKIEFIDILKLYNVHWDDSEDDLASRIIAYIKLSHRVLNIRIFVFIGLKSFLSNDVLDQLLKTIAYEKVNVLLFERYDSAVLEHEKRVIIDKDACLIY